VDVHRSFSSAQEWSVKSHTPEIPGDLMSDVAAPLRLDIYNNRQ